MRLERILETVLYYSSGQEDELARFYGEVLGLHAVGRSGLTFRVGEGLLLLFDAGLSSVQSRPPPHGARGPIHTCFVAQADEYEGWKQRVTHETGSILEEIEWDNGVRSFYFHDRPGTCWRSRTAISGRRAEKARSRDMHCPRRGIPFDPTR